MFDKLKTIALSAMIGLGGLAAMPAAAQADGLYLNFGGHNDARFGVYVGDRDARYYRGDRDRRGHGWERARCTPERAQRAGPLAPPAGRCHTLPRRSTRRCARNRRH